MTRREFVFAGAAGLFAGCREFGAEDPGCSPVVRFGMVTDLHYADIGPDPAPCGVVGRRFYRESRRKLREAVAGADFVQVPSGCHCTRKQMTFLHDHGIRTVYSFANDAGALRALVAEGHDFILTDRLSALRTAYDALQTAGNSCVNS